MSGGHCLWWTPGKETPGPQGARGICYSSLYTEMLQDDPGIFLLGQHYEKITNALHAMLGDLFLGCPCTLCSYHQAVAGLRTSKPLGTCSDWPLRSVSSFAGISFKPRVALLLKLSAGGRDPLGFCFMALLQCSRLCQGLWSLGRRIQKYSCVSEISLRSR